MRIAQNVDVSLGVWDIETLRGLFDIGIYNPDTKEFIDFEISPFRNDLYKLVAFYTKNDKYDYWVSFNGIGFDHQVLQYIVQEHQNWTDYTWSQICRKIHDFVQLKIIEAQRFKIALPYYESSFPVKPLDVFRIHHFDNEAKRTSLKWVEYMMDMDVEEMPIHHTQESLTAEEIKIVKDYRKHDLIATHCLLLLTLGELDKVAETIKENFGYDVDLTHLEDYKGKNKIQDRFDVQKETGLDCLNWSDVKIGEEWNKKDYMTAEKLRDASKLFTKKIKHPYGQRFKNFFPSTMKFQTKSFIDFFEKLGNEYVKNMKQEFTLKVGKTTYTIAKGGLHSTEKDRRIIVHEGWKYTDLDVGLNCGPIKTT